VAPNVHSGATTSDTADGAEITGERKARESLVGSVRQTDIEPYTALRWLSTLFKAAAIFLAVAVIGEFIAGLNYSGVSALSTGLGEVARTTVLAVVLWGAGDLVRLLIQLGHDVRAERILLSRLVHRTPPRSEERDATEPEGALNPRSLLHDDEAA
jgi:hypothetical protein